MSTTEETEHIEAGGNAGKTGSDTGASAKEKKPTPVKDRLLESQNEDLKETLRVLKNKQTAALCNVTKKRNLLSRLMTSDSNLHLVKSGLDEYNELFLEYQACYVKHWETITDETVQQHETQRYESKEISVVTFRNQVSDWIVRAEQRVQDTIGSSSGASNTSRSSTRSSTSSKVAKAKAKLAELMVEKAMLKQKQALHEQEQAFQLDLEIAKTKAREQALSACMSGVNIDTKSSIDVANETLDSDVEEIDIDSMHDVNVDRQVDTVDPGFMNVEKSVSVCLPSVTRTQAHLMSNQGVPENVTSVHHSTDFVDASVPQTNVVFSSRLKPSVTETYSRVGVSNIDSVSSIPVPESFPAAAATAANVQRVHLNPDAVDFRPNQQSVSSDQSIQQIMEMQRQQNEQVLSTHRQIASVMSLPLPEVPKFVGDVMEYHTFILAFDARVASRAVSDADRMYFLQQYLEGEARDLIAGCVLMEPSQGYAQARTLLQQQYGDPHRISMAYVDKVIGWPHIGFDDNLGLRKYSVFLIKCLNTMQSMSHMTVLNHSPNMQAVVCKLPAYLQNKWRDYVTKFRLEQHSAPAFCHLVRFIQTAAESANDPVFSKQALSKSEPTSKKAGNRKQKSSAFAVNVKSEVNTGSTDASVSTRRCFFCKGSHDLDDCQEFDKKSIQDKRNFLKEKRMCYGCFGYNHTSKGCLKKRTCKKCKKKHPTVLHIDGFQLSRDTDKSTDFRMATESGQRANAATSSCNVLSSNESSVILQSILPVRVSQEGSNVSVVTYAFYDQGSTGCFISEDLLDQVGATNTDTTLQLKTMHGNNFVRTKAVEGLKVADINNRNIISLPKTFSRSEIPVGNEQIPKPDILRRWSHLREIASDIPEFRPDLQVGLLIGSNCPRALEPLKVIPVSGDGPFAMLLRHGWTVNGPTCFNPDTESVTCHRVVTWNTEVATEAISPTRVLEMFDMDFEGCCVGKHPGEYGHSVEDRQFLKKAEADVHLVDGHYVLPFPFRDKDVVMPNNREQAVKRALWQKKKMLRDMKYREDYISFINGILSKGYAKKIRVDQLDTAPGKVWYLPHHGIYHPRKPDKIRVVFDCSAKFSNVSLNDKLLQGPDMTNSLVGVLTRFRQDQVGFIADIEAMFHQVRIPIEHYNFVRFLWWPDGDLSQELEEYHMTVHLFGAVSSPSICNFALRQITVDHRQELDQDVIDTITRNFYVDDCLRSASDDEDAISLIQRVTAACLLGGFRLSKFTSNSNAIIQSLPKEDLSKQLQSRDLDCTQLPTEHALGVRWITETDSFGFAVKMKEKPPTRRGVLSLISSVYDPLGFLAPFMLPAKKILQELCREVAAGWDDPIPERFLERFKKWMGQVPCLERLSITRCLKPEGFGTVISSQLHVFADASSTGYGSVAYLRLYDGNTAYCSFLMGKARLAPSKTISIPRLELTAATVAVRIGRMMMAEVQTPIDSVYYYTDSTTVLYYICNAQKRFPVFVANRVQQIRDFSNPNQWYYIATEENPADDASRGLEGSKMDQNMRWLKGPAFFLKPESEWPVQPAISKCGDEPTTEEISNFTVSCKDSTNAMGMLINRFSDWRKLRNAASVFLTLKSILLDKRLQRNGAQFAHNDYEPFNVCKIQDAEVSLIKYAQHCHFNHEIEVMNGMEHFPERGRVLKTPLLLKSSSLYRLDPFMDRGLLKVGGRLSRSQLPEETKHPILLPRRSHITDLIIRDTHQRLSHAGRNFVIAKLRERYWIPSINAAVRYHIHRCVPCRRFRRPCSVQKMADLPTDRLTAAPPFTWTGVDFFGPYLIKQARKEIKHYGVLFTCLASRCVHIETTTSLESDCFINTLRRFLCRRGPVRKIRCDNGTNFTGAERELRLEIQNLKQDHIKRRLLDQDIEWEFNPPYASHMGGIWERQIRSVRNVLASLLHDNVGRLDGESFRTLLCEVESIMNSRPLTPSSNNPDDLEALTPNHILTMKPAVLPPPGQFQREDIYLRKRWRKVQHLANLFWSRWKREYLLTLQQRTKWTKAQRNFQIGDIVLMKDDSTIRSYWPMGRIISTRPDSRGTVRSVTLKTAHSSELTRPIHKLVLLLPADEAND